VSNFAILERLEDALEAYAKGTFSRNAFVDFLSNSIRALEGVPLAVTHELRRHEYAIDNEGYFDEEGFESRPDLAQEGLRSWIHELKRIYA
jgi:hypothetical protein